MPCIRHFPHCEALSACLPGLPNRRREGWEKQGVEAAEYVSSPLPSPPPPASPPRIGVEQVTTETGCYAENVHRCVSTIA